MVEKDRVLLQQIGDKMREIRLDVWVDYVLKETENKKNVIIEDVRYQNEFWALKKHGWYLVRLKISTELQKERLMYTYPDNYQIHLNIL